MERKSSAFAECATSLSIRIVADCRAIHFQSKMKLKRATTLEFTTISAIIFIHCCSTLFIRIINFSKIWLLIKLKVFEKVPDYHTCIKILIGIPCRVTRRTSTRPCVSSINHFVINYFVFGGTI